MSKPTQDYISETDRGISEIFKQQPRKQVQTVHNPIVERKASKVDTIVDTVMIIAVFVLICVMYIALWLAM